MRAFVGQRQPQVSSTIRRPGFTNPRTAECVVEEPCQEYASNYLTGI